MLNSVRTTLLAFDATCAEIGGAQLNVSDRSHRTMQRDFQLDLLGLLGTDSTEKPLQKPPQNRNFRLPKLFCELKPCQLKVSF